MAYRDRKVTAYQNSGHLQTPMNTVKVTKVTEVTAHRVTLDHLADRLSRLTPCHRDPHAYHEGKRSIVAELRRLARRIA
jgi:hypothetical protein